MCAAKPSSVVGWPVVARHGRLICNLAYVSPSASEAAYPEVQAFFAETAANGRLIAAAPAMFEALTSVAEQARRSAWTAPNGINNEFRAIETFCRTALSLATAESGRDG
jgi:hypothetical protein